MEFNNPLETSTPALNTTLNESSSSEIESIQKSFSQETKILLEKELILKELYTLQIENQDLKAKIESQSKLHDVDKQYFAVIYNNLKWLFLIFSLKSALKTKEDQWNKFYSECILNEEKMQAEIDDYKHQIVDL